LKLNFVILNDNIVIVKLSLYGFFIIFVLQQCDDNDIIVKNYTI